MFILLGAIVNVAVAWGCALLSPTSLSDFREKEAMEVWERFIAHADIRPNGQLAFGYSHSMRMGIGFSAIDSSGSTYGRTRRYGGITEFAGWPFYSLTGSLSWNDDVDSTERILPLRPMWPGFAVNTIFYAVLLGLVFLGQRTLRRRRRLRRGRCPACAYPIGVGPICTECGGTLPRTTSPNDDDAE